MEMPPLPPDTDHDTIDTALAELAARATEWARLPLGRKIEMLEGLKPRIGEVAGRWVTAASRAKGLPVGSSLRGEEWASGPWATINYVEPLADTLRHIQAGTAADLLDGHVRQRPDGQTVVRVMPAGVYDRLLLSGVEVDVWQQPGVTPDALAETVGVFYKQSNPEGKVALVLGAGNIAAIPPLDVLYKLYADGEVVLLKMNPVNSYLGPILEEAFAEFVDAGYLRLVYGGAEVGEYLTRHDAVDSIHVTGSAQTHDAIVYGTGADGKKRKADDRPAIDTPVTSELGGISPCIVVPGDWSEPDLDFQAEHVASQKMHNGGFNCIASQVLVLPEAWAQRDAFVGRRPPDARGLARPPRLLPRRRRPAGDVGRGLPRRRDRRGRRRMHGHGRAVRARSAGVHQTRCSARRWRSRACPAAARARIPATGSSRAVDWCNDTLAGTLGATILIHPRTLRQLGDRFEDIIGRLRYGTIGVNIWSGAGFLIAQGAWGAFPGHERDDIQSGTGVVHNAWLFDKPQKTVVYGPFAPFPRSLLLGETHASPKPLWFVTNDTADVTAQRVTEFAARPSPLRLPAIFASALRG